MKRGHIELLVGLVEEEVDHPALDLTLYARAFGADFELVGVPPYRARREARDLGGRPERAFEDIPLRQLGKLARDVH